jgi:hypothetical protein
MPFGQEVGEDRLQHVDRDEHVPRHEADARNGLRHDEGADAEELSVRPDKRGAAVVGMGGRREDGVLHDVFPGAREFPPRGHASGKYSFIVLAADDDDGIELLEIVGAAEGHRRARDWPEGAHEAEPGLVIVGDDPGGYRRALGIGHGDAGGLDDEVTDGEDEAAAVDHDAAAGAFRAEERRGSGLCRDLGIDAHDGVQEIFGWRLRDRFGHGAACHERREGDPKNCAPQRRQHRLAHGPCPP